MLSPYRVLDLTSPGCGLAGFLLAQFGADVVLGEPPAGWPRTATFDAYHRGKRSVLIESQDDLDALVAEADIVLVDGVVRDGALASALVDAGAPVSIDLDTWRARQPELITVSVTPWGLTGPKADWLANDLTLVAASGQMAATGDSDRPPVRISVPQAFCHASAHAAVGTLVALTDRANSGVGQHVDVSAQQATAESAVPAILHAPAGIEPVQRVAGGAKFGSQLLRWVYECADGWAIATLSFGEMIGPMVARFMQWVWEEGYCDEATRDKDWVNLGSDLAAGREPLSELERIIDIFDAFCRTKTKAELLERGLADSLLLAPVSELSDVLTSPQLADRDFWDEVATADGGEELFPGPVVKATPTPLRRLGASPTAGADGPRPWSTSSRQTGPAPAPALTRALGTSPSAWADRPLAGVRVCDLAWVAAAPLTTKILAYWGAEVIRVESVNRPCLLRQGLGHRDDIVDQENAITWHSVNANKKTIALDLSTTVARDVVRDLVAVSDMVLESFTPGTLARMGLGYDDLRAVRPDLIMASSCVMGQTGPYRDFAGFGNMSASVAGFFDITGWPDRLPAGPYMAYTDYTSPRFTAVAMLAALDHRRRTGEGQYLDFSQSEASTHFLSSALVDYQRTGEAMSRMGNADLRYCPHGVYPAHGEDEWVAIVCETDAQWRSLAIEMRRADLADLGEADRRRRERELDDLIAEWTRRQDGAGLAIRLQAHGIPAHSVQNSGECFTDPQLVHRGHFQWAPHGHARRVAVDTMPHHLSRSPGGVDWGGPMYGEHTMEVLMDILGYDGDHIARLAVAEALE